MANPIRALRGRVKFKQAWGGPSWNSIPGIFPQRCLKACAPTTQTADFHFEYGKIKREDTSTATIELPRDLRDWYVKIELWDPFDSSVSKPHWYGIIPKSTNIRKAGVTINAGSQTFQAVGLEHILDREWIAKSIALQDNKPVVVEHVEPFNMRYKKGLKVQGNRTKNPGPDGVYLFSRKSDAGVWNNRQVLDYILEYWQPEGPRWKLTGQVDALEQIEEVHSVHRGPPKSMLEWLNLLIDRRRGLGFIVEPSVDESVINIRVFTLLATPITVGSRTIPANPNQIPFFLPGSFPGWHLVDLIEFSKTTSHVFDWIEVHGERMLGCTTVAYDDARIKLASTPAQRADYIAATEEDRTADRFDGVWTRFVFDPNWNYNSNQILGVNSSDSLLLKCDDDGKVTAGGADAWHDATILERSLPFKKGFDYTKFPPQDNNDTDDRTEFLPLQIYAKMPADTLQAGQWRMLDKLGEGDTGLGNCNTRVLDTRAGFQIHCSPHHLFAAKDWPKDADGAYKDVKQIPRMDYKEVAATVAFRTDRKLIVRRQITDIPPHETQRVLIIQCPGAEYWYATRATVVDIKAGALQRINDQNRVLRDDSDILRGIAAFVEGWYQQERQSVQIPLKQIDNWVAMGVLLTDILGQYNEPVNTIVSSVETSFPSGTMKYQTGWGDYDIGEAMVEDRKGLASRRANEADYSND